MGTPLGRLPSLVPEVGFILVMDVLTGASSFYFMKENNRQGGAVSETHSRKKEGGRVTFRRSMGTGCRVCPDPDVGRMCGGLLGIETARPEAFATFAVSKSIIS